MILCFFTFLSELPSFSSQDFFFSESFFYIGWAAFFTILQALPKSWSPDRTEARKAETGEGKLCGRKEASLNIKCFFSYATTTVPKWIHFNKVWRRYAKARKKKQNNSSWTFSLSSKSSSRCGIRSLSFLLFFFAKVSLTPPTTTLNYKCKDALPFFKKDREREGEEGEEGEKRG